MIVMAGIDHNLAPIDLRERFSLSGAALDDAYKMLGAVQGVSGAVIVSTCNRTELYINAGMEISAFPLLCRAANTDGAGQQHYSLSGLDVMRHLIELASGLKSLIWGEDQIIAQVKASLTAARERQSCDSALEVMFRDAVAAAKKIKTEVRFGTGENSVVYKAMDVLRRHGDIRNVLVIGNGEIGRLMTRVLIENGLRATMTLRTYRHGETVVPAGAHTVDYAERYAALEKCGALISATRSPHHTIELERVRGLAAYPELWIDLAVPRDIDPEIQRLPGAAYYDIDSLCGGEANTGRGEQLEQAGPIIEKYAAGFERWLEYRRTLDESAERREYFPLFISSEGKRALVAGGGAIAARRVRTLARFRFEITVVAPDMSGEIEELYGRGGLTLIRRKFEDTDIDGCFLAVAATNDREVNRRIGELAAARGIFATVADRRDECGFLFPAIVENGDIVAGVTSGGKSHHAVKEAAKTMREALKSAKGMGFQ